MFVLLLWVVLAVAIGVVASGKDRSAVGWFFLALIISPLLAGIFLLIIGEARSARCPFCAEKTKPTARVCPHCRNDIVPPDIQIEGDPPPSRWKSRSGLC